MQTFNCSSRAIGVRSTLVLSLVVTLMLNWGVTRVSAFDGAKPLTQENGSPFEAVRSGFQAYQAGNKEEAVNALQYAADRGNAMAQWKLGRMYAAGDGVPTSPLRAFEYFRDIANNHAEDSPTSPEAPFVANAFVELGGFFERGIEGSYVGKNPYQSRQIYAYAASYFGNSDAQFRLAKMYLEGRGGKQSSRQASRWLKLAAEKGHVLAQMELGRMLFEGDGLKRRRTQGLKWMTIALDRVGASDDDYVRQIHESALAISEEKTRRRAVKLADRWLDKNPPLLHAVTKPTLTMPSLTATVETEAIIIAPLEPLQPVSAASQANAASVQ
ncbi:MAG: sel1 repeat family protein [Rhizobiales bacterium]|nr:sel1 repeat family protein [Hyphomicrobiales bacterium]